MSAATPFVSPLAPVLAGFLALKRALGRGYAGEEEVFRRLDAFLAPHARGPGALTATTFAAWGQTLHRLTPTVRRRWLRTVRNLCLYRQRTEPACFVPDPALFPRPPHAVAPYIFTPAEVARLLQLADRLPPVPRSPLRPAAYRLALILLYTTGLRRGELLRLTVEDYDPTAQTLRVRASKFHKSRCLPLAADGVREIERYLAARRTQRRPVAPELPLVWCGSRGERAYSGGGFGQGLRGLFRAASVRTPAGRIPRIHDLRHNAESPIMPSWFSGSQFPRPERPELRLTFSA